MPTDPNSSDQDEEGSRASRWPQLIPVGFRFSRSTPPIRDSSSVLHHNIRSNDQNVIIDDSDDHDDSSSSVYADLPPLVEWQRHHHGDSSSSSDDDRSNARDELHEAGQPLQSRTESSSPHLPNQEGPSVSIFDRLISFPVDISWFPRSGSRRMTNNTTTSGTNRQTHQPRYNDGIFIIRPASHQAGTMTTTTTTTRRTTKDDGYIGPDVYRLMFADGDGPRDRINFYNNDEYEEDDDDDYETDQDDDDEQDSESDDDDDDDDDIPDLVVDIPDRIDNRRMTTSIRGLDRSRRLRQTIVVWDGDLTTGSRQ